MKNLPQNLIDIIVSKTVNPKGIWANYNCNAHYFREVRNAVRKRLLKLEDLESYPDVGDYPDLYSEPTECVGDGSTPTPPTPPTPTTAYYEAVNCDDPNVVLYLNLPPPQG